MVAPLPQLLVGGVAPQGVRQGARPCHKELRRGGVQPSPFGADSIVDQLMGHNWNLDRHLGEASCRSQLEKCALLLSTLAQNMGTLGVGEKFMSSQNKLMPAR